jgi:hypothetical protein
VVDQARLALCRELARCIKAGNYTVRVRVTTSAGRPVAVRADAHSGDGWHKQFECRDDHALIEAFDETLALLASTRHHDDWSAQRRAHADGYEVELQFHPDKFKDRAGSNLESVLTGLLFRDRHDSNKDSRRSIRTPRQTKMNS